MRRGHGGRQNFTASAMLFCAVLALTFGQFFHAAFHEAADHGATALCAGTVGSETHWHSAAPPHGPLRHGGGDDFCPLCSGSLNSTAAEAEEFSAGAATKAKYAPLPCRFAPADAARHCRARAPPVC